MFLETHIKVSDIPEGGLFLNFEELTGVISELDDHCTVSRASGRLELERSGSEIKISGWVRARLILTCDRCLNTFWSDVQTPFFYLLKPSSEFQSDLESDHKVNGEEIEIYWYEDDEIRAEELFREQILLQLPMRLLCRENCKGLCPGCGVDLNKGMCQCEDVRDHGPFSVLAGLKIN